ncbi:MAG: c-type cytochrome [Flavobacteriales bacterium]|nr:c-type cytochrome [Flavobacteriales bacterium]MCB9448934.1 c-type cytochrome [Flavobacteriales bacterium]
MKKLSAVFVILAVTAVMIFVPACRKPINWNEEDADPRLSGGKQTVFVEGTGAFSQPFPDMSEARLALHELGDAHFEASFVASPAPKFGGLGPIYNSNACFNCHINDGRGKPIASQEAMTSMLFRVSVSGTGPHGGPLGAPGFGGQLQDKAVFGKQAEATVSVSWVAEVVFFDDGDSIALRKPQWSFNNAYLPLPSGWMYSARVAPPVFGLGLLEQIDDATLYAFADPDDRDGDGISGKPNLVWDVAKNATVIGKFGWKAEAPTLAQQVAGAYNEDMGLTSYLMAAESSVGQSQHDLLTDDPEVPDSIFNAVVFYVQSLAVPARRKVTDATVLKGQAVFQQAGCNGCHIASVTTKVDVAFPETSNQLIHPYTDMLLHDMGPDLADGRPAYEASGSEWRTPPLWGIGLTKVANGHTYFLHDGRARNLMEAILWHGGEALQSREFVRKLNAEERDALITFLDAL